MLEIIKEQNYIEAENCAFWQTADWIKFKTISGSKPLYFRYKNGEFVYYFAGLIHKKYLFNILYLTKINFDPNLLKEILSFKSSEMSLDSVVIEFDNLYKEDGNKEINDLIHRYAGKRIYFGQPPETNIIKLHQNNDLIMSFEYESRRRVRKCLKDSSLEFVSKNYTGISDGEIADIYNILNEISLVKNRSNSRSIFYYQQMRDIMKDKFALNIIRKDGRIVGGYFIIRNNKVSYELYGGVSETSQKSELTAFLKYKSIENELKAGQMIYDQGGASLDPNIIPNHYYKLGQFKKNFGGEFVKFPEIALFPKSKILKLAIKLDFLKSKIKNAIFKR